MLIVDGVGSRLREERERLGLSQEDFGARVGVSRGTQQKYELAGAYSIDLKYLAAIETVGADASYVLTAFRTLVEGLSADEASVLDQFRSIPSTDQRAVRLLLQAMVDDSIK
ncbi:helix-turn-helix domain-containing protein [Pseudomonas putida]|uniref:helix-turn-helix domain-containing protein n=1 Tax=Pseudomonas putida TaxID=303 RepID=UPI001C24B048|nr:helix-turn-helix domain-containing protein [Pseudomonas putida]